MVKMGVGEQNVGCALDGLSVFACGQHRIACEPGVYQEDFAANDVAKRAVAEPEDLHDVSPRKGLKMSRYAPCANLRRNRAKKQELGRKPARTECLGFS